MQVMNLNEVCILCKVPTCCAMDDESM